MLTLPFNITKNSSITKIRQLDEFRLNDELRSLPPTINIPCLVHSIIYTTQSKSQCQKCKTKCVR